MPSIPFNYHALSCHSRTSASFTHHSLQGKSSVLFFPFKYLFPFFYLFHRQLVPLDWNDSISTMDITTR